MVAPWGCASLKLSIPPLALLRVLPPSATIIASFTSIVSLLCRCPRRASLRLSLSPGARTHTSAARSALSATNNAAHARSLLRYPRLQRAPIVSTMSSSDDDTPLAKGKDQGKSTCPATNAFRTRHAHLTLHAPISLDFLFLLYTCPHPISLILCAATCASLSKIQHG